MDTTRPTAPPNFRATSITSTISLAWDPSISFDWGLGSPDARIAPDTISETEDSATLDLTAGPHDIRVEFIERTAEAVMRLLWSGPGIEKQVIPTSNLRVS